MPVIPVKTYYLEMENIPKFGKITTPPFTKIIDWHPNSQEYLEQYTKVGDPWGWTGRTQIPSTELDTIINSENTFLFLLLHNNKTAGFVELTTENNCVEIKYFGILNEFQGKGIGGYFLKWSISKAWSLNPKKVTVHTCEYDHKDALAIYQKYGFKLVKTQIDNEFYSDEFLSKLK